MESGTAPTTGPRSGGVFWISVVLGAPGCIAFLLLVTLAATSALGVTIGSIKAAGFGWFSDTSFIALLLWTFCGPVACLGLVLTAAMATRRGAETPKRRRVMWAFVWISVTSWLVAATGFSGPW